MFVFVSTLFFICLSSYLLWLATRRRSRGNEPPLVWYWLPWIGSGLQYRKEPIKFLESCKKKHGPIFTVHMGGKYFTYVLDPFTHPAIAKESKKLSFRVHTTPMVKQIFGFTRRDTSVPTMNGLLPKYLQGNGLDDLVGITMKNFHEIISEERFMKSDWEETGLLKFCYEVMFEVGFKSLFGHAGGIESDDIQKMVEDFVTFDNAFPFLAQGYPISSIKGAQQARENFWNILTPSAIRKRKNVLEMFKERDEMIQDSTREYLGREYLAVLWGAEANTSVSTFWTLYFILKHPEAYKAARKEIDELLKETGQDQCENIDFTRSDMSKMTVLDSIINESLRLSVSPSMLRQAMEDCSINVSCLNESYSVRKDDKVFVVYQLTHYDEEIYPDAKLFKYDRFLNEDGSAKTKFYKNDKLVRYNLQPFGSGLSKCPGRFWAVTELKQFVVLIMLHFDIELLQPEENVEILNDRAGFGALAPSSDVKVRFRRKKM